MKTDLDHIGGQATPSSIAAVADFLLHSPPPKLSQRVGDLIAALFLSATGNIFTAQERHDLTEQMDQVVFELAAYRADHGQYPETLDALVPNYIAAVPDDTFAEKPTPIRYLRTAKAWRMWSVGMNGIDDDGRNAADDPNADDIVLAPRVTKK